MLTKFHGYFQDQYLLTVCKTMLESSSCWARKISSVAGLRLSREFGARAESRERESMQGGKAR